MSASDLTLRVAPRWKQETLAVPSAAHVNEAGQSVRITRLAALVSSVTLRRADGGSVNLDGQFGFLDAAQNRLEVNLRGAPDGDYAALEFNVGVPPAINHDDPARWPAAHALNPLVNGLHWSWQGGYVFLALEGRWRAEGMREERGFIYHLANDEHLMRVRLRADFKIAGDTTIDLAFDLARMVAGRKLGADDGSESTHSAPDDRRADQLAGASLRAWFWLGSHASPSATAQTASAKTKTPQGTTPYAFIVPPAFPQPELPADNPLTVEGIALGRALFSDPRLSSNGSQSCASCHAPAHAFSDRVALSKGADGAPGARNAMPLSNLAWSPNFAWDGGQPRIRDQARAAWTNPIEMHGDIDAVVALLRRDSRMEKSFAAAFGTPEVTAERITLALEQYILTLVSADSKFDRALKGAVKLTDEEQRGLELFAMEYDPAHGRRGADCFHCHGGPLFTDFALKSTGLDRESKDTGRMRVTGSASDRAKFKTPSLRNVALTAPYMHDGRFATLEEAVAHYDHGVQRTATLDPNLAKHPDDGMKLTAADQRALVAFLRTLTDDRFAN